MKQKGKKPGMTVPAQMYVLNLISNLNSNYAVEKKHGKKLQDNINRIKDVLAHQDVQASLGKWEVVWGPALQNSTVKRTYKARFRKEETITRSLTDNAMYVARKAGTGEYFIGISGTNGISMVGWFDQDFDVEKTVSWPPKFIESEKTSTCKGARISKGAMKGLKALWNMESTSEGSGSLIDFLLKEMDGKAASLSVGGHSLGGCLTPVLATAIGDRFKKEDGANPGKGKYRKVQISAYPTAGPTPGNAAFASHMIGVLAKYHATYNGNDLVPLSWDFDGLGELKENYSKWKFGKQLIKPEVPLNKHFLYWAANFAKKNHYTHKPSGKQQKYVEDVWFNDGVLNIKDEAGKDKTKVAIVVFAESLRLRELPKQLKRIYDPDNPLSFTVDPYPLARFLLQVGLQHVPVYSRPSSKEGHVPWQIDEPLLKQIKRFFQLPEESSKKSAKRTTHWKIAQGYVMFLKLTTKAADWLHDNPPNQAKVSARAEIQESGALEEPVYETEEEALSAFEAALDDSDGQMPWEISPVE